MEIRYIYFDEEPQDTSKDARARVCDMCAKESAPVGFDDGRHSDIPGSLSVQLRMPRKIVERPKQVLVPLVQEPPRTRIARS